MTPALALAHVERPAETAMDRMCRWLREAPSGRSLAVESPDGRTVVCLARERTGDRYEYVDYAYGVDQLDAMHRLAERGAVKGWW